MADEDYLKDLFYVHYCNCCKDLDVMSPLEVPCHHPWYCHMDGDKVQELEASLGRIKHNEWLRGYLLASERDQLYDLKQKKYELVKQK